MNIFRLDDDPHLCAEYHCDSHLVKMILEYGQLLSTAHHVLGSKLDLRTIYKKTHENHPSAIWVRQSKENYQWLHRLLSACCAEYTFRYGRVHKVEDTGLLDRLKSLPRAPNIPETPLLLSMPDEFKQDDPVAAYRSYYAKSKTHLLTWRGRPVPKFLKKMGFIEVSKP